MITVALKHTKDSDELVNSNRATKANFWAHKNCPSYVGKSVKWNSDSGELGKLDYYFTFENPEDATMFTLRWL